METIEFGKSYLNTSNEVVILAVSTSYCCEKNTVNVAVRQGTLFYYSVIMTIPLLFYLAHH